MNRRHFVIRAATSGILIAMLCDEALARRTRNVPKFEVAGARQGESLEGFLNRKGFRIDSQFAERVGDDFLTRVTDSRGDWLNGPLWTPPESNPDQHAPPGWPGITLWVYEKGRGWIWSEFAVLSIELKAKSKVRLTQVAYDPRLAQLERIDLGALV